VKNVTNLTALADMYVQGILCTTRELLLPASRGAETLDSSVLSWLRYLLQGLSGPKPLKKEEEKTILLQLKHFSNIMFQTEYIFR